MPTEMANEKPKIKQRGSGLLKVVTIIMIILGAITIGGGFISMGSGSMMASRLGLDAFGQQYFHMIGTIAIVTGAVELIIGVLGLINCNRPGKANFLLTLGVIQLVAAVFSTLYNHAMAPMGEQVLTQLMNSVQQLYGTTPAAAANINTSNLSGSPFMIGIGFVLPILFIIGALLNKRPSKMALSYDMPAPPAPAGQYTQPPQQEAGPEAQPEQEQEQDQAPEPESAEGAQDSDESGSGEKS